MQPWQDPQLEHVRQQHREFAKSTLEGDARQRDRDGEFSRERWQQVADFGVLGICMPHVYGGQGRPVCHAVAAFEGLGQGCSDTGFLYALASQLFGCQMVISLCAPEALKQRALPGLIAGPSMIAHAFTEESSGSDAFSMQTEATRVDGGYSLTGKKCFITNGPHADQALVFAKTQKGRSPFGLITLLVDLRSKGASHGREFLKMGLKTVRMGELVFDNVFVPDDCVVGGRSGGLNVLAETTGWERGVAIVNALGPMARSIDACQERALTRKQYDRPIGSFQQVSSRVADMVLAHRVSRQLIYDMAARLGNGDSIRPHLMEAAIVKLYVSENFIKVAQSAVQIMGVRGYLLDSFAQQDLRDSIASTIWAGTSETLRNTIAKFSGLPVD